MLEGTLEGATCARRLDDLVVLNQDGCIREVLFVLSYAHECVHRRARRAARRARGGAHNEFAALVNERRGLCDARRDLCVGVECRNRSRASRSMFVRRASGVAHFRLLGWSDEVEGRAATQCHPMNAGEHFVTAEILRHAASLRGADFTSGQVLYGSASITPCCAPATLRVCKDERWTFFIGPALSRVVHRQRGMVSRPVSGVLSAFEDEGWVAIHLSDLPRECLSYEACGRLPMFDLAPGGVYRATLIAQDAGALLPHRFTLTCTGCPSHRRSVLCGTFLHVTATHVS